MREREYFSGGEEFYVSIIDIKHYASGTPKYYLIDSARYTIIIFAKWMTTFIIIHEVGLQQYQRRLIVHYFFFGLIKVILWNLSESEIRSGIVFTHYLAFSARLSPVNEPTQLHMM